VTGLRRSRLFGQTGGTDGPAAEATFVIGIADGDAIAQHADRSSVQAGY